MRQQHYRQPLIVSLMLYGVVSLPILCEWAIAPVFAQVLPDGTTATDIGICGSICTIEGGDRRGGYLFHSFQEFNVGNRQQVRFANPRGIETIFSRITGNNPTRILGVLGVNGNADLFLLNPNGILFGPNARLDINGSFVASTADSILLGNATFNARNPNPTPLLTVNVPLGLQYGTGAGPILVEGSQLAVLPGETLALVGGDIRLTGRANLTAPGGRIELGSVTGGRVDLLFANPHSGLNYENVSNFANLSIAGVNLDVAAAGGGSITLNAENITLANNTVLSAGIREIESAAPAGNITLNATEAIAITNSTVTNSVQPRAVGDSGNITLTANRATLRSASILSSTTGTGNAGRVSLNVEDTLFLSEINPDTRLSSTIGSLVSQGARGNSGGLIITAGSVMLQDGATLDSSTLGNGNAGNIDLTVRDRLSLRGLNRNSLLGSSLITSVVGQGGRGNGGNIAITAGEVSLEDGAVLSASSFGGGNAGNITLTVDDRLSLSGRNSNPLLGSSLITSVVGLEGRGRGGNITITADAAFLEDGAILSTGNFGEGSAGDITLTVSDRLSLSGINNSPLVLGSSSISSVIGPSVVGNGGNITIQAGSLTLDDGAIISSSTDGQGDSGDIRLMVEENLLLRGRNQSSGSIITSLLGLGATGEGGNTIINADSISLEDGAAIGSSTFGRGDAGDITLTVNSALSLSGYNNGESSSIQSEVAESAIGDAGDINIQASLISLTDAANISAETTLGQGGNITLSDVNLLLMQNGSRISTTAGTAQAGGDGGDITLDAALIVAPADENSDIRANAFEGRGGNVSIFSQGLFGIEFRPVETPQSDITASSEFGIDGIVTITSPDVDPNRGLTELPTALVDASQQIAQTCPTSTNTATELGEFVVTGRGGLPPNPADILSGTQTSQTAIASDTQTTNTILPRPTRSLTQAQALQDQGLHRQAIAALTATLEWQPTTLTNPQALQTHLQVLPVSSSHTAILQSLGESLRIVGNLEAARAILQHSLETAEQLQEPEAIALAHLRLGNLTRTEALVNLNRSNLTVTEAIALIQRSQQGDRRLGIDAAEQFYRATQQAIAHYQQSTNISNTSHTQISAQLNQLRLAIETERHSDVQHLLPSVQHQIDRLPPGHLAVEAQINFAQSLMKWEGEQDSAFQLLNAAVQQSRTLHNSRLESYGLGYLAEWYEQNGQFREAQELTQQALLLAQAEQAPEIVYRWQWQLGRLLKAQVDAGQGDYQQAIAAYTEAVNTLQSIRADLVAIAPEQQISFRETIEPIYRQLVALLLDDTYKTPTAQDLQAAREAIESLQLAELDNFFRAACLNANPRSVDQVDQNAAVIYPIILPDQLAVIVSLPQWSSPSSSQSSSRSRQLIYYTIPVTQVEIESTVSLLRDALDQPNDYRFLPPAQQLYDWLIRPLQTQLASQSVETLVFVLDGALRNVPMTVLHDGEQYLIEQPYSVALTPGLQLLETRPSISTSSSVLLAGITEARPGFSALPRVEDELGQIQSQISDTTTLLNQGFASSSTVVEINGAFTNANFQTAIRAKPFSIVHLATHGQFSSQLEETYILTEDSYITIEELKNSLQATSIRQDAALELLVLSACETAVGDEQATLGLAGMAVRSGARSTIATLWQVNDNSSATFMGQFYRELTHARTAQTTKAEALRLAQRSLLQHPDHQHPYYWAPYVLIGNWQ
jgi:filamentous hemagglutinin family protein